MTPNVKFKDATVTICINGQRINQNNLTQEDYEYLLSWNQSFASYFEPVGEKEVKPKQKSDGKAKEV